MIAGRKTKATGIYFFGNLKGKVIESGAEAVDLVGAAPKTPAKEP